MVIEVAVLSMILSSTPIRRCGEGTHTFTMDSCGVHQVTVVDSTPDLAVLYSQSLELALAEDLSLVPEVRHVMVERAEGDLLVWVAVDNPTKEVRESIFRKQFEIIDGFPEVEFDFNIIAAKNRAPAEFASSAKLVYSREGK